MTARQLATADLDWNEFVRVDPQYFRPSEVDLLLGDPTKVKQALGWRPRVGFRELVEMMIRADLESAAREKALIDHGFVPQQQSHLELH